MLKLYEKVFLTVLGPKSYKYNRKRMNLYRLYYFS